MRTGRGTLKLITSPSLDFPPEVIAEAIDDWQESKRQELIRNGFGCCDKMIPQDDPEGRIRYYCPDHGWGDESVDLSF